MSVQAFAWTYEIFLERTYSARQFVKNTLPLAFCFEKVSTTCVESEKKCGASLTSRRETAIQQLRRSVLLQLDLGLSRQPHFGVASNESR